MSSRSRERHHLRKTRGQLKKVLKDTGEVAQCLKGLDALSEDLSSDHRICIESNAMVCRFNSRGVSVPLLTS